jgi:hypothetical protein
LFRLRRTEQDQSAIEVVMLRHQVSVLRRQVVRPAVPAGTVEWVPRLAKGSSTWGFGRTGGELATMGLHLAPSSVWAIRRRHGAGLSPRWSGSTWSDLVRVQAATMVACDFFHVDRSAALALRAVLYRARHPEGLRDWYYGQSDGGVGHSTSPEPECCPHRARGPGQVLHPPRDSRFTASFDQVFRTEGIRVFRTPIVRPRGSAFSAVRRHRPPGKPRQVAGLPTRSARVRL